MLSKTWNQIDTTGPKAGQTSEWPTNANAMQETVEWEDIVALRDLENFPISGECSTRRKSNQDMISAFAPPCAPLEEPLAEAAYKHAVGLAWIQGCG
jgi:hypothetical protein